MEPMGQGASKGGKGMRPRSMIDMEGLRAQVKNLDPTLVLMSLIHMTGNGELLSRYRGRTGGAGELDKTTTEAAGEIREMLVQELASGTGPKLSSPDERLFAEMVEFCLRESFSTELLPLLRDHVRFPGVAPGADGAMRAPGDFKVLVIGAGMTGIIAGIKLAEAGFDYKILEARDEVGGTWSINRYPGVAVDTSSQHYSLSFALNPSWSKFYPEGREYLAYLKDVSRRFGLLPNIDFRTRVSRLEWDEHRRVWTVTAQSGGGTRTYEANAVVSAVGFFSRPLKPPLPGLDCFQGTVVHSAEWDSQLELAGRRVVLLGSGCTAIQIATAIAPEAEHLTILQRQPNWIMPAGNAALDVPPQERWALESIPFYLQWARIGARRMVGGGDSLWRVDPSWPGTNGVSEGNDRAARWCLDYLQQKLGDRPDLLAMLIPDYPFFAKRPMLDCGYLDTLRRPNVELRQATVSRVEPEGIVLASSARLSCDVLVLATGFELDFLRTWEVIGKGGMSLAETFGDDPRAYLGMTVPGFPNLFITSGPNSLVVSVGVGGGHNTTAELQTQYIVACLRALVQQDLASMEVKREAADAYNRRLDESHRSTVWQHGGSAHGYYRNGAGRPQIFMPLAATEVREMMQQPDLGDYWLVLRTARSAAASASGIV